MYSSKIVFFFALLAGSALAAPAPVAKRTPLDSIHQSIADTLRAKINSWPGQIAQLDAHGQKEAWEAVDNFLQKVAKEEGFVFDQEPRDGVLPQFIKMAEDDNVAKMNLRHVSYKDIQEAFNEVDDEIAHEAKHHSVHRRNDDAPLPVLKGDNSYRALMDTLGQLDRSVNLSAHDEKKFRKQLIKVLQEFGYKNTSSWQKKSSVDIIITVLNNSEVIFAQLKPKDKADVVEQLNKALAMLRQYQANYAETKSGARVNQN